MIPDRSPGRPSPRHRVSRSPGAAATPRRPGVAAAYAAAVLGIAYAMLSLYWAAGGTALLSTVGGSVEEIGRQGGLPAVALGLAAAGLKLAAGLLALALVRPWGRAIPRMWLLACATGGRRHRLDRDDGADRQRCHHRSTWRHGCRTRDRPVLGSLAVSLVLAFLATCR